RCRSRPARSRPPGPCRSGPERPVSTWSCTEGGSRPEVEAAPAGAVSPSAAEPPGTSAPGFRETYRKTSCIGPGFLGACLGLGKPHSDRGSGRRRWGGERSEAKAAMSTIDENSEQTGAAPPSGAEQDGGEGSAG